MDNRNEVREFLMSRRAKLSRGQAGLTDSGHRRVPGLRRGEVAMLADVSGWTSSPPICSDGRSTTGALVLSYEGLELTARPGLSFLIYTAEPGSPSQQGLDLLASWATTGEAGGAASGPEPSIEKTKETTS